MGRFFPVLAGIVVVLASGLAHGLWTDRWGLSSEPAASASRLNDVAMTIGDWEGKDGTAPTAAELTIGEITNYLARTYVHRINRTALQVLIVCGRPGPIGVHTPDVCFVGSGQDLLSKTRQKIQLDSSGPPLEFFIGHFRRTEAEQQIYSRAFWSWSGDGVWTAPDSPRLTFCPRFPALFKLYIVRNLARTDEPIDSDPAVAFMKEFIPELDRTLFGKSSSVE